MIVLISTTKMPRFTTYSINRMVRHYPPNIDREFFKYDFAFGSRLITFPSQSYKLIHIADDNQYAFETVVLYYKGEYYCLYVKIIGQTVDILISTATIKQFVKQNGSIISINRLILFDNQDITFNHNLLDVIPPIFDIYDLEKYIDVISNSSSNSFGNNTYFEQLRLINKYIPSVFEALIYGQFRYNPLGKLIDYHPDVVIPFGRTSQFSLDRYKADVTSGKVIVCETRFDSIVLDILKLRVGEFTVFTTVENAIEGHFDLTISSVNDVYRDLMGTTPLDIDIFKSVISDILDNCISIYCRMNDIDIRKFSSSNDFLINGKRDSSSITLTKNIHDEITISIHDEYHGRWVCFYTSAQEMMFGTMSVVQIF